MGVASFFIIARNYVDHLAAITSRDVSTVRCLRDPLHGRITFVHWFVVHGPQADIYDEITQFTIWPT